MQTAMPNSTTLDAQSETLRLGSAAARLTLAGGLAAAGGLGLALTLGLGHETRRLFFHAYLVAFTFWLSIALGSLFFVLLHHLSRAGWSVTLRRLAEALSGNLFLMAVLAIPLIPGMSELYEWAEPAAAAHDPALAAKAGYLNPTAFFVRMAGCFAVWCLLAGYFRNRSIRQDQSGDPGLSTAMERVSAPGMILFAVTITVAAVDLLMSLNPHWSSTIVGVYFFSDAVLGGLIVLALLAQWLQRSGRLGPTVTVEHYHDLGKLTFAFVFFWGYIAFSQYMLMWYANMPEETQFYMPRQIGPWLAVSVSLVFCHLLIPFVGLMSRRPKRRLGLFTFWAGWLLGALLLDMFYLIMPNLYIREIPAAVGAAPGTPLPAVLKQLLASNQSVYRLADRHADFMVTVGSAFTPTALAIVFGLTIGMGGLLLVNTARLLQGAALVPVRDPRLGESLTFENR